MLVKNEERIVELLADLLKRSDQQSDILENQSKVMGKGFSKMAEILEKHTGMFEAILLKLDTFGEHEKRIGRLEDKVFGEH